MFLCLGFKSNKWSSSPTASNDRKKHEHLVN